MYAVINFHHLSEYQSPSSSSSSSKANNNNKTLLLKGVSSVEVSKHTRERQIEREEEKSRPQDLSKAVVVEKTNQEKLNNRKIFGGVEEAAPSTSRAVIDKEASNKKSSDDDNSKREKVETKNSNMLSNPIENHYSREPDLRYTSLSDVSRSISSYAIDSVTANRLAMQEYDVQSIHTANHHRPYDSSALVNSQTAFERYDPNYTLQRTSMYSPYCQPTLEELASQQKYLLEQQQPPLMKTEPDDSNNGPIYPRPIYHAYDPTGRDFTSNHLS